MKATVVAGPPKAGSTTMKPEALAAGVSTTDAVTRSDMKGARYMSTTSLFSQMT